MAFFADICHVINVLFEHFTDKRAVNVHTYCTVIECVDNFVIDAVNQRINSNSLVGFDFFLYSFIQAKNLGTEKTIADREKVLNCTFSRDFPSFESLYKKKTICNDLFEI